MKRTSSIKRSISCMDLVSLEIETPPRKRLTSLRSRSLSASDLVRKAKVDQWLTQQVYDDDQDDLLSLFEKKTDKKTDTSIQLELLDHWEQHLWLQQV
ncbi:hypothetical protein THRCLA_21585 [Thraustotheca clavata]|uniref:Uncharacterized protein n=1 Tax=Thraustotheca clavata TaxID=74557 RepID=A0A1V9ZV53_9STRA|nr:hypothetical protein THRCLA_21585 [Thraustotheca clavata]